MDNTDHSSTPTKTQKVLEPLQILPNTYFERMEPKKSSLSAQYQASSCLVGTKYGWKDEASPIVDNARSSIIPNQDQKRVATFLSPLPGIYVLPNPYL